MTTKWLRSRGSHRLGGQNIPPAVMGQSRFCLYFVTFG
jgi:hypothetical protein